MNRPSGSARLLGLWLALALPLSACQSTPGPEVSISSESSLLAVDVVFPVTLGRDPDLVEAFVVKGPIHAGLQELPELIPASFVKRSRAYWLDPEPGTYSLVAVTSAVAAPLSSYRVAGGVEKATLSGTIANAIVFPEPLIHRIRTTVAPGGVAFMGVLEVEPAKRINANAVLQDDLQRRLAERIRPGATSETGLSGWFTLAWMVDLEKTSISSEAADRRYFLNAALTDLRPSPWAKVIAREQPREATAERPRAPEPSPRSTAPVSETLAAATPSATPSPQPAPAPETLASATRSATPSPQSPVPQPAPPPRERRRFPGLPPGSALAEVESGMSHEEVRKILGEPDARVDRFTAKAWIPFYTGPGAYLRDWVYEGEGRVVFSLGDGSLEVIDVVADPDAGKVPPGGASMAR